MPAVSLPCPIAEASVAPAHARGAPDRLARALTLVAGAAVIGGAVTLAALHFLPGRGGLGAMSEPLSEYALGPDGWLFDVAVLALALGLALLVLALVRSRCLGYRSPAPAVLTASSLSLVLVVIFPEHDSSGAVHTAGQIHWAAAMVAFGSLSVAPVLFGQHRASPCSRLTARARRLSAGTCPCFVVALAASLARYRTRLPVPTWSFGVVERTLVVSEFAVAALLTTWAWRGCACDEFATSLGNRTSTVFPLGAPLDETSCRVDLHRSRPASLPCPPGA